MRFTRSVLSATTLAALTVGSTAALAAPASAAANTTPQKVCGSGYKTVNSAPVGSLGTIYLTYNSSNGKNCVATIRSNPGTLLDMAAYVHVPQTEEVDEDWGLYASYAGPTYVYGKAYCVSWGGHIKNLHVQVTDSNCGALKEKRVTFTR